MGAPFTGQGSGLGTAFPNASGQQSAPNFGSIDGGGGGQNQFQAASGLPVMSQMPVMPVQANPMGGTNPQMLAAMLRRSR